MPITKLIHLRTSVQTLRSCAVYSDTNETNYLLLSPVQQAISKVLGSGKIKKVPKEEAFLYPEVTQTIYDMLTVNLNMEPILAVDMKWISETVFVENVPQVVTEYKDARGLKALKIFVHGPPAVGKTILSKKLCEYYKVHYLSKDNVVEEAVNKLYIGETKLQNGATKETAKQVKEKERAQEDKEEADEEEEEEEDELQENLEELYELLEEVQANMAENEGQLDDSYLMRLTQCVGLG
uniref:Hydin adenylate kinase-like domain-containing protein n=1 Tax=Timema cristinae TaxID=61476 RepID=A0A7R9D6Q6_TIMCR|nr:unnamed protein product [Timema cristinae]